MNHVFLIGNLTKDIEIRYTQSQKAIGSFTLAVKRNYKNSDGKYDSDFITCVCMRNAETLAQYAGKGSKLGITGHIQTGSYTNKEGKKVYTEDVIVDEFEFLDKKQDKPQQDNADDDFFPLNGDNDSIPF